MCKKPKDVVRTNMWQHLKSWNEDEKGITYSPAIETMRRNYPIICLTQELILQSSPCYAQNPTPSPSNHSPPSKLPKPVSLTLANSLLIEQIAK